MTGNIDCTSLIQNEIKGKDASFGHIIFTFMSVHGTMCKEKTSIVRLLLSSRTEFTVLFLHFSNNVRKRIRRRISDGDLIL